MSISPPSDIVLDVAKAADPTRYKVAAERLNALSASKAASTGGFAEALQDNPGAKAGRPPSAVTTEPERAVAQTPRPAGAVHLPATNRQDAAQKAYRGFEAAVLGDFVQAMMPKDAKSVFGSGTSGEIWKSMLAEKIGEQLAQSGGVGLAAQLAASHPIAGSASTGSATVADNAAPVTKGDELAAIAADALRATTQRHFLAAVRPDQGNDTEDKSPA